VDALPELVESGDYDGVMALTGIAPLASAFDGFIIDQWGVLHDGTRAYPQAAECLRRLREAGRRVVVLSNSGRREAANVRLLEETGFPADFYVRVVSAGEDAREALAKRVNPFHARLGTRYFAFTRAGDDSLLAGLPLERVERIEDAQFLVVIGIDSPRRSGAEYEEDLQRALACGLPMVCANPDLTRVSPDGLVDAPGLLARRYEESGGEVFIHGKPHPAIYGSCLEALGCDPGRVVAIGDSLEHDVLGASRAGLKSAFVCGGIHADELGAPWGHLPAPQAMRRLLAQAPARPDYLVPAFAW
jgi:HAD superfamily hydrolase (TIGR01459 family)